MPFNVFRSILFRAERWINKKVKGIFQRPDEHQGGKGSDFQQPNRGCLIKTEIDHEMSDKKLQHIDIPMIISKILTAQQRVDIKVVKTARPFRVIHLLVRIGAKGLKKHLALFRVPDILASRQFFGPTVFAFDFRLKPGENQTPSDQKHKKPNYVDHFPLLAGLFLNINTVKLV